MQLQEYKCPNCGGTIKFDSGAQKLKCEFCDTEFTVDSVSDYNDLFQQAEKGNQIEWTETSDNTWNDTEDGNVASYICESCGGQIIADQTTAASSCPYCGNPIVMTGKVAGELRPDYVIPFKLDKETAKEKYLSHLKGKRLLPKLFRSQNHIDEIKGMYVPFWLFDSEVDAAVVFKGTKTRYWSDSRYNYSEISHYAIERAGNISYEHIPVDGSERMDDTLMESLEPYDFSEAVDFNSGYLAGYLADRYDIDSETAKNRAIERMRVTTKQELQNTTSGYSSIVVDHESYQYRQGKAKYAFYPIWLLNTTWNDQKYTFAMNGQTGKFVGNLPVDLKLAAMYALVSFIIPFLLILFIGAGIMKAAAPNIPEERQKPLLVDDADLLSDSDELLLLARLEDISSRQECEVAVVTVYDEDDTYIQDYADDYYDYNGYGYGDSDSGILLLIDMYDREWAYTTFGYGIDVFTDERQAEMTNAYISYLSEGDYNTAFNIYADECDRILTAGRAGELDIPEYEYYDEKTGQTYYGSYEEVHEDPRDLGLDYYIERMIMPSAVAGGVVALIVLVVLWAGMDTVKKHDAANIYIKENSLIITRKKDVFLYKNVTKTRRESSSSSGGSHGGGGGHSTVHHSSSGRSHGGSHGHF